MRDASGRVVLSLRPVRPRAPAARPDRRRDGRDRHVRRRAIGRRRIQAVLSLAQPHGPERATTVDISEDGAKILTVLAIARLFRKNFNDPVDGIIYGTFAGLGAGVEESLLYLTLSPATVQTLAAEVVRLVAHALMGGVVGWAVGFGAHPKGERKPQPGLVALSLSLSLAFHIAWDVIAYQPEHGVVLRSTLMGLLCLLVVTWGILLKVAVARSRDVFAPRGPVLRSCIQTST